MLAPCSPTFEQQAVEIDSMFYLCSYTPMPRVDDDTLSLHLEVALSTTAPSVLDSLGNSDRRRRQAAVGEIVRQLVERLRCFDIHSPEATRRSEAQTCLFHDLGPIG